MLLIMQERTEPETKPPRFFHVYSVSVWVLSHVCADQLDINDKCAILSAGTNHHAISGS